MLLSKGNMFIGYSGLAKITSQAKAILDFNLCMKHAVDIIQQKMMQRYNANGV